MEMLSFDLWLLWMCVEAAAKLQTFYFILFFTLGEWTKRSMLVLQPDPA